MSLSIEPIILHLYSLYSEIRPNITYYMIIAQPVNKEDTYKIEKVQRRATKLVLTIEETLEEMNLLAGSAGE